jgi:hypothetical protein
VNRRGHGVINDLHVHVSCTDGEKIVADRGRRRKRKRRKEVV